VHSVFGEINYGGLKHNSLYLGLVLPSGGWQSLISTSAFIKNNIGLSIKISITTRLSISYSNNNSNIIKSGSNSHNDNESVQCCMIKFLCVVAKLYYAFSLRYLGISSDRFYKHLYTCVNACKISYGKRHVDQIKTSFCTRIYNNNY
jgi:hypothetical protein